MSDIEILKKAESYAQVLDTAISHYGMAHQIRKCIEELTELSMELQRWMAYTDKYADKQKARVVDEIADVVITASQMSIIFGKEAVEQRIDFKIKRLQERIEQETLKNQ